MDRNETMRNWDTVRSKIAAGDTSSAPRDWFDGVIDEYEARIAELEAGARRIGRREAMNISGDDALSIKLKVAEQHKRIAELEAALREIDRIGSAEVADVHELWLITGNMTGEARRVLNCVPKSAQ